MRLHSSAWVKPDLLRICSINATMAFSSDRTIAREDRSWIEEDGRGMGDVAEVVLDIVK